MTQSLFRIRWFGAWAGALLLTVSALGAPAATHKHVLILNPFGRDVEPFSSAVSSFRSTLTRELGAPVDLYEIPLELARLADPEGEGPLVGFLADQIRRHPVDLVVSIGGAGLQFAARHRQRLFPTTPLLVVAAEPRLLPPDLLQSNATLVTQKIDVPGLVEDILRMQPQTAHIAVVFGDSALERFWVNECRREFATFANRVQFTWLNGLPLDQIVKRCAALPPNAFILHGLFLVDATGIPYEQNEALLRLHRSANAPLFGIFESEFGLGPVGGRLFQNIKIGTVGARTAIRILHGESPASIPPQIFEAATPVYDARELRRWGIRESRLPAGSLIQFREPGFWERYRWPIAGTVLFCALQGGLIVGLLVNRAKRRQGEAEATLVADISSKFVNLPPAEVDRAILDAQRRICTSLGLDVSVLWQPSDGNPFQFEVTHLHRGPHALEFKPHLSQQDFPWTAGELLAGRTAVAASLRELPAEAAVDVENARRAGIKSHVTIPLLVGGKIPIGLLGFNATQAERAWPDALVKRLQLIAEIFSNALARKRADQALHESEERMAAAAEAAEFGLWGWNLARNEVWGSARWLSLFGFTAGDTITFEQILQRIHPVDREAVELEVRRAAANHTIYKGEFRVIRPDGTERWIASRGRMQEVASGHPDRMLGAARDVTARRQADDRVRQLSFVVEQSPVSVVITDLQGTIIYVNRKFCEVSGYAGEECLGRNPRILKSGRSPLATYEDLWTTITRGETWRGEFQNRRKNGELYWEWAVISPLLDATGKATHFLGVKEDITARKQAEMETAALRKSLAHADRVTVLGQLASALAHELSQPLGAILRNAEAAEIMLQAPSPDLEELRAITTDILRDDQRAGQVIDRLRSLLKRRELDLQPIDLPEVIAETLSLVNANAAVHRVMIDCSTAPDLPRVRGDRVHLQQVLINLLVNAMDALEGGAVGERRIQVRVRPAGPGTVEVCVSDNGPGIPLSALEQLFDPFFTTKPNGMGIGLAVSKTIIEAHRGRLWAENQPEGGACFCFTLPIADREAAR